MIIPIDNEYRLITDEYQWIVQKRRAKVKDEKNRWKPIGYYASVQQAIQSLGERLVRESKVDTLGEALAEIEKVSLRLSTALDRDFNIRGGG